MTFAQWVRACEGSAEVAEFKSTARTLRRRSSRWIAVAVTVVVSAVRGHILASRRLRKLPNFGKGNAALLWD